MAGKVIAVTGASRGIGAAIAAELAGRGFTVGCLKRQGRRHPEATAAPAPLAKRLLNIACDVNDEASIGEGLRRARRAGGARSAGWSTTPAIRMASRAQSSPRRATRRWDGHQRALGIRCASREAYPYLFRRAGGTIVNIGSFFDKLGVKQNLAYCASKAAVGAITRCLAVEWAPKKIRVLDVAPGYIETELNAEAIEEGRAAPRFWEARVPHRRPGASPRRGADGGGALRRGHSLPHRRERSTWTADKGWRTDGKSSRRLDDMLELEEEESA